MIVFLYGPDDWRRLQKKQEVIKEFLKKNKATGLAEFNMQEPDELDRFAAFTGSPSMFDPLRLAVVENALSGKEPFAALLKKFAESRVMTVLVSDSEKRIPKAFAFLTKKPVLSQEFAPLVGPAWSTFVKAQAKNLGVPLNPAATARLAQYYAGNSWALITELEKLACLGAKSIAPEDIDIVDEGVADFWRALMGLRSGSVAARLTTLERLLASNEAPAKIFNILAASWKEKTAHFARFDLLVKSGKMDYEEALLDLVIS